MSEYRAGGEHGESSESPEAIQADIAHTRDEMSSTIDAIQAKLNPEVIKAQVQEAVQERVEEVKEHVQDVVQERVEEVKEHVQDTITEHVETVKTQVHDATIGRVETMVSNVSDGMRGSGNGILDTIKANPVPTALAGLGLGWFLTNRQHEGTQQMRTSNTYASGGMGYGNRQYSTGGSSGSGVSHNDGPSVGDRLGDAASSAKDRVGQLADTTGDHVGAFKDQAGNQVSSLGSEVLDTIKANPVLAALVGLGLGWFLTNRQHEGTQPARMSNTYASGGMGYGNGQHSTSGSGGSNNDGPSVGDRLGDAASSAKDRVGQLADTTGDHVGAFKDQAGNQVSSLGSEVLDTIKANPVPAALIGISLGWVLMNRQNAGTQPMRTPNMYASGSTTYGNGQYSTGGSSNDGPSAADRLGDAASGAKDRVGQLADTTGDRVSALKDHAGDTVSSLKDQAGDTVSSLKDQAGSQVSAITDRAQDTAVQAKSSFQQTLETNPLTIGALAIALGLAAGLALPTTPVEDRAFGDARDNLVGQVQAKAQDTIQKVQQVAQDVQQTATQTAKDSAQRQGLASAT